MTCRPPKMNPHLGLSPKRNPYLGLRFPPCLLPDQLLTRFPLDNRKAGSCTVCSDPFGHRLWQWNCAPHCVRFLSGGVYSWRRGRLEVSEAQAGGPARHQRRPPPASNHADIVPDIQRRASGSRLRLSCTVSFFQHIPKSKRCAKFFLGVER